MVENALGILKEKFPCLNYLRVQPSFASDIFNCCVTLCNFARSPNDPVPVIEYASHEQQLDDDILLEQEVENNHQQQGIDRLNYLYHHFRE